MTGTKQEEDPWLTRLREYRVAATLLMEEIDELEAQAQSFCGRRLTKEEEEDLAKIQARRAKALEEMHNLHRPRADS